MCFKYLFLTFCFALLAMHKGVCQEDSSMLPNKHKAIIISQDSAARYTIGAIELYGNKKTKSYIVLREVPFKVGNTFAPHELTAQLELARQQIMNSTLFVDVVVAVVNLKDGVATVRIEVKERWYLFPLPYFKLVDRNFNQWWYEQNRNLNRVNYGLKFNHYNFSGRNDKLSIDLVTGYNQQVAISYNQPFADKSLKHGFALGYVFSRQKEMNYKTTNNKQTFFKKPDFVKTVHRISGAYSYRPDSKYRLYVRASYTYDKVNDSIPFLNPDYFPNQKTSFSYVDAGITLQYFNVDYIPFPKKGFNYELNLYNRGFSKLNNMLNFSAEFDYAIPFTKNFFLQQRNWAVIKLSEDQPFYNKAILGYGDNFLRGLESYVVDGTAGWTTNTTLYQKLFSFIFKPPFKTKTHDKIPFTFYLKAFGDVGYAYNKQIVAGSFSNKLLYTSGFGLDIVSIYDFVFRLEYRFNQFNERGFGFRVRGDF